MQVVSDVELLISRKIGTDPLPQGFYPLWQHSDRLKFMAKKNHEKEKALLKAADLILDLLAELPPAKARAARNEIRALALKSSRSIHS